MYRVFVRNWWKRNKDYPGGRKPCAGRKTTIQAKVETVDEARTICKQYNDTHEPGFLSRKAEFESR